MADKEQRTRKYSQNVAYKGADVRKARYNNRHRAGWSICEYNRARNQRLQRSPVPEERMDDVIDEAALEALIAHIDERCADAAECAAPAARAEVPISELVVGTIKTKTRRPKEQKPDVLDDFEWLSDMSIISVDDEVELDGFEDDDWDLWDDFKLQGSNKAHTQKSYAAATARGKG